MSVNIIFLKLLPRLPGANELIQLIKADGIPASHGKIPQYPVLKDSPARAFP